MYHLTGPESELPPWIETHSHPRISETEYLRPATVLPLRYFHEVPEIWKEFDPGFYILLRDDVSKDSLPPWILLPEKYAFCPMNFPARPGPALFLAHHSFEPLPWENLLEMFALEDAYWVSYAGVVPDWPEARRLDGARILASPRTVFSEFIDLSVWKGDTLSPLHVHLLQNRVSWRNPRIKSGVKVSAGYGEWRLSLQGR